VDEPRRRARSWIKASYRSWSAADVDVILSSGQGETAAVTAVAAAASFGQMSWIAGVERVVSTRVHSDIRGLATAGRCFRIGRLTACLESSVINCSAT
jgi:hypothetical protein